MRLSSNITPCVWFDDQAEDAARFYVSVFENSRIRDRLSEGGDPKAQQCGWLKDKFGLSWQVFPRLLQEMISDPDREKADRAMTAMLRQKKFDVAELQRAIE